MDMVEEGGQNQPNKRIRIVEEEEEDDRISVLPDCLIVEILSRLPFTKDAVRAGTLSKRWRHLWISIPTLVYKNYYAIHPIPNFFSFVDKTLTQRGQLKLNKFKLEIGYNLPVESDYIHFQYQVNLLIHYAINCNVEEFEIGLFSIMARGEFVVLPQYFFTSSCFTHLKLEGCLFNPTGAINWKKLVSLDISEVKLDEDLIENILSGSPVLETLKLQYCYGFTRLDITSKSVKNLVLDGYSNPWNEDSIIKINAPYILSLTIKGGLYLWKLLLLNVPSLVKARLNFENTRYYKTTSEEEAEEKIIQSLSHVKELELSPQVRSRLEAKGFIFPSNIKVIDVISNMKVIEVIYSRLSDHYGRD